MRQTAPRQKENEHGRLTLVDLLSAVALFMPMAAMVGEVKVAGGGVLRYLFGLPLTLLLDPLGDPKVHKMVKFRMIFEFGAHNLLHSLNRALRISSVGAIAPTHRALGSYISRPDLRDPR